MKKPDLTQVTIEFIGADVIIQGKSIIPLSKAVDGEVEAAGWQGGEALIALAEIVGAQCAMHDHNNGDFYFVEMFTAMLGNFYGRRRSAMALASAEAPPKHKLN